MRSKTDYIEIFDKLNPGFFDREYLKDRKEDRIFAELVMSLCFTGIVRGLFR